jgi:hypothetical protein
MSADVILAAGPPRTYSARVDEQQHKLIAEQLSDDVCATSLKRRSLLEVVGGVLSARAEPAPVDENLVAPFVSDAVRARPADMRWLSRDFYITDALAATGFRLGRHRVYMNDFLSIIKKDGTIVFGRLFSWFHRECAHTGRSAPAKPPACRQRVNVAAHAARVLC